MDKASKVKSAGRSECRQARLADAFDYRPTIARPSPPMSSYSDGRNQTESLPKSTIKHSSYDNSLCRYGRLLRLSSLRPDIRRLDDRPPFLDFGLVIGQQSLGGQLFAREDLLRDVGEAFADGGIGKCIHDGLVELGDDVFRRVFGDPQCMPEGKIKSRQSGFVHRRDT